MIDLEKIYNSKLYKFITNSINTALVSSFKLEKLDKELHNKLMEYVETYLKKTKPHIRRLIEAEIQNKNVSFILVSKRILSGYCILAWNPLTEKYKLYIAISEADLKVSKESIEKSIAKYSELIEKFVVSHISDIVYSIYQTIIRYRLMINYSKLKVDYELLKLSSHILTSVIVKIFGKRHMGVIEEEKIKLINLFISYVILTSYLKYDYRDAIKTVIDIYSTSNNYKDIVSQFKELTKIIPMKQFTDVNELGQLLSTAKLLDISSAKFTFTLMNTIGVQQLVDLFSSYPGLISCLIIVKYPIDYLNKILLVGDLNQKLEDYVIKKYL